MQARALAEARVDADRMLLATRSALAADADLLTVQEQAQVQDLMAALEQTLQQGAAADIEAAIKTLADGTENFAAQRMNRGIRQALAGKNIATV